MENWRPLAIRIALGAAGLLVLLIACAVFLLRTGPGDSAVAWMVREATDGQVAIEGLGGALPDHLHADRVTLRDKEGVWLQAKDVALDWSALSALHGRYIVQRLQAAEVAILRSPKRERTTATTPEIEVDSLSAPSIRVAKEVGGRAERLSARGSLHYVSRHDMQADLILNDLNSANRYAVKGSIRNDVANGRVAISEAKDGLLAALAGLPDIGSLSLQAQAGGTRARNSLTARLQAGGLMLSGNGVIDLNARFLDVAIAGQAPPMHPAPDIAWDSLVLSGHVRGRFDAPVIGATARVSGAAYDGMKAKSVSADANGRNGKAKFDVVIDSLHLPGAHPDAFASAPVKLSASVDFAQAHQPVRFHLSHPLVAIDGQTVLNGPLELTATAATSSLGTLAALQGVDLDGAATLKLEATEQSIGTDTLKVQAVVRARGDAPLGRLLGRDATIAFDATAHGSDIDDSRLAIDGAAVKGQASGSYRSGNLDYSTTLAVTDLSRVAHSLRGSLTMSGNVNGPANNANLRLIGHAAIASRGSEPRRISFDMEATGLPNPSAARLRAQGDLDGSAISLSGDVKSVGGMRSATFSGQWKSLAANGLFQIQKNGTPAGTAHLTIGNLEDIAKFAGAPLKGHLDSELNLVRAARASVLSVLAHAEHLSVENFAAGKLSVQGMVSDPFQKPVVGLSAEASGLSAAGFAGSAHAQINGPEDRISVALDANLHDKNGRTARLSAAGAADLAKSRLTLARFAATWRDVTARLVEPATINMGKELSVDRLDAEIDGGIVAISGRFTPTMAATVSVRRLPAHALEAFAAGSGIQGDFSGTAHLAGSLDAPQGTFAVRGSGLRVQRYQSRTIAAAELDAHGTLHGKTIRLDAALSAGPSARLSLEGDAPLTTSGNMNLRIAGRIDAGFVAPFLAAEGRSVKGWADIDMHATGKIAAPRLTGTGSLHDAELRDYTRGLTLQDVQATFDADGAKLRIVKLSAHAGEGTIEAGGTIDLAGRRPVDVVLKATKARPIASDLARATVSGKLKLTGTLKDGATLSGELKVLRGDIDLPEKFPPQVAVLNVRRKNVPPPPPQPQSEVALDLVVDATGPIFVRGHGLDAVMGGRIRLQGSTGDPIVEGGFTMDRGTFEFAGQNLNFTSGKVRFDGQGLRKRFDPTLDFAAQSASGGVTATLTVGGYASQPKFSLTSAPQLPQDEILARLLFQQSVKQLTPLQLAQIAEGIASLGGVGEGMNPLARLRRGLGLDRLAIGSVSGGTTGQTSQTTVEAGRYVARNVYLGTKQNLSGGTQVQVQVDITKMLKAQATLSTGTNATATQGTAAQDNGNSVGLSYQFEY